MATAFVHDEQTGSINDQPDKKSRLAKLQKSPGVVISLVVVALLAILLCAVIKHGNRSSTGPITTGGNPTPPPAPAKLVQAAVESKRFTVTITHEWSEPIPTKMAQSDKKLRAGWMVPTAYQMLADDETIIDCEAGQDLNRKKQAGFVRLRLKDSEEDTSRVLLYWYEA